MQALLRILVSLVVLTSGPLPFSFSRQPPLPVPQLPPAPPPPAAAPPPPSPSARVFGSPAGLIFNLIKPDKTADFELVMGRLRSALTTNPDPIRQKQGAGWKMYKASEPFQGSVLYIFVVDPAVPGADYSISRILAEMYPSEVQDLYVKFRDSYATGQTLWNMTPVDAVATTGHPVVR